MSTSPYGDRLDAGERLDTAKVTGGARAAALLRHLGWQDLVAFTYLVVVRAWIFRAGPSADATTAARLVEASMALFTFGVVVGRVLTPIPAVIRAAVYRVALTSVVLFNYGMLPKLFPVLSPFTVDAALLRADLAIFGGTPALWLERLNVPSVIEYFSFFYFSYYLVVFSFVIGVLFVVPQSRATTEFAFGTIFIFSVAQLSYFLVPAYGPVAYLQSEFHGPLQGGLFWSIVHGVYLAGSAAKDVFPSMHTGGTLWYTLYAVGRARESRAWRLPAAIMVFVACNIVFSTVLLRWHYAIDLVAGASLATFTWWLSRKVARVEEGWRAARGLPSIWPKARWFARG